MIKKNCKFCNRKFFPLFCLTSISAIIIALTFVSTLFAQDCRSLLKNADNKFALGRFEEAMELAERCLNKSEPTNVQEIRIHELQALSFIATDYLDSSEYQVRNLLKLNPNYQANPDEDPLVFLEMIDQLRPQFLKSRRKIWLWLAGGGVASSTAAVFLLKGKEKAPRLPDPPGFPVVPVNQ